MKQILPWLAEHWTTLITAVAFLVAFLGARFAFKKIGKNEGMWVLSRWLVLIAIVCAGILTVVLTLVPVENIKGWMSDKWDTLGTIAAFSVVIIIARRIMQEVRKGRSDWAIFQQLLVFSLVNVGIVVVIFTLIPPDDNSAAVKGDIITFLAIVISAMIALSSATLMGNMLAGILLRLINNYHPGDMVEVKEYYGKISVRGLFHTEIQTIDSDLITLPNLFLATNPVKVSRTSGTLISAEVSLGYDVSRIQVENCMLIAAKNAGLENAYVIIAALNDYSILYQVYGQLTDMKNIISSRSLLRANILDSLHGEGVEIVSPTFMNQRQVSEKTFIPEKVNEGKKSKIKAQNIQKPEDIIFDKADKAKTIEQWKSQLEELDVQIIELQQQLKGKLSDEEKKNTEAEIGNCKNLKDSITSSIEDIKAELKNTS